jgi:hypothetical protein
MISWADLQFASADIDTRIENLAECTKYSPEAEQRLNDRFDMLIDDLSRPVPTPSIQIQTLTSAIDHVLNI